MKIAKITNNTTSRYFKKNTIHGNYERNKDLALTCGLAFGVQLLRMPFWQIPDIGITAGFGALAIKKFTDALKNRKDLTPIKKRALNIKNRDLLV